MHYVSVEVGLIRKQAEWFVRRGLFPLIVQFNDRSAIVGKETYDLYPIPDDWIAVGKNFDGERMVIGEISVHTIRRTISKSSDQICRAIRAAVLNVPYDSPRGYRIGKYTLIHPGECWRRWQKENPSERAKPVNTFRENDDLCIICEEGFQ